MNKPKKKKLNVPHSHRPSTAFRTISTDGDIYIFEFCAVCSAIRQRILRPGDLINLSKWIENP